MSREVKIHDITERERLIETLRSATMAAVESIVAMAKATKRLTEMGVDVTELGLGISGSRRDALINIANDALNPNVYQCLGHRPSLLKLVCTLPKPQQDEWANGIPVKVYLSHVDDDYLLVKPDQLSRDQTKQVFAESGGLRTRAGQLDWIAANVSRAKHSPVEVSEVLYGKGFVEFTGPTTKTLSELLEIVTRLTEKRK